MSSITDLGTKMHKQKKEKKKSYFLKEKQRKVLSSALLSALLFTSPTSPLIWAQIWTDKDR